jgi:type IV pilus biogenesis protein CpaD/CtpE
MASSVGRLLVLIRYNQPNVDYAQQLSQAVGTAMERRPNAEFSVVAVSPANGDPAALAEEQQVAQKNADDVKRSLVQMGLSPSRITMANTQAQTAETPEVHVYIR